MIQKIFALLLSIALVSCGTIEEEIMLEADGSGLYEVKTDVIPMAVDMAVTMTKMFASFDTTLVLDDDSLRTAMLDEIWEDFGDEVVDSIIDVSTMLPDSVLNKGDNRTYYDKMTLYMRGSRAEGHMYFGLEYPFTSQEDLQNFMTFFEELQKQNNENDLEGPLGALSNIASTVTITADAQSWRRKTVYSGTTENTSGMPAMDALMGKMKYITTINTKKKIKSVKGENLKSADDYQVVFEYDLTAIMNGEANTDIEITF